MLKSGLLPAPTIIPQNYEINGTRVNIDPNTYIDIKCTAPGTKIYFTVDGTKPDPFQRGKTGKSSTIKYIGAFRLKLGNRVLKAIAVSRDKLRESPITTKYINVVYYLNRDCPDYNLYSTLNPRNNYNYEAKSCDESVSPSSDDEESYNPYEEKIKPYEMQGAIEGPINPTNYSGTQINIWGFPSGDFAPLADLTTPKPQIAQPSINELPKLEEEKKSEKPVKRRPEHFEAFCTQLYKVYEKNIRFRDQINTIVELAKFEDSQMKETNEQFLLQLEWTKYERKIKINLLYFTKV